jgi:demethylmenaquinone methyltransferase/2-methoxy-6-polyprenyl-1,4-benzoquinol methylase
MDTNTMINIEEVIDFFDGLADKWDAMEIKDDNIINTILDNAGVIEGCSVLDVACGTGIMIPYYLNKKVSSVTAVDISPKMVEIARHKFEGDKRVNILCCDVEKLDLDDDYDNIVIYNAFPHFQDAQRLIRCLSSKLRSGGRLTVAHGMSKEKIDAHHKGSAIHVSNGLMEADELADIFNEYLEVTTVLSDDNMYQVVGMKL